MSHLGDYFRTECKCQMLTPSQVARRLGYRNINKGVRRLLLFERTGTIKADLLVKLVQELHMDWQIIEELAEEDRQERLRAWEAWANEPVPMRVVVRLMAAVNELAGDPQARALLASLHEARLRQGGAAVLAPMPSFTPR